MTIKIHRSTETWNPSFFFSCTVDAFFAISLSVVHSQSCDFGHYSVSRGSVSSLSNGVNRYKPHSKSTKECPCFHNDENDNDHDCPTDTDPLSPLVDCASLPREFIECALPVDHKGNQTAKDISGHGCVKVRSM